MDTAWFRIDANRPATDYVPEPFQTRAYNGAFGNLFVMAANCQTGETPGPGLVLAGIRIEPLEGDAAVPAYFLLQAWTSEEALHNQLVDSGIPAVLVSRLGDDQDDCSAFDDSIGLLVNCVTSYPTPMVGEVNSGQGAAWHWLKGDVCTSNLGMAFSGVPNDGNLEQGPEFDGAVHSDAGPVRDVLGSQAPALGKAYYGSSNGTLTAPKCTP